MSVFGNKFRKFRNKEDGSTTIEFAVLFPAFFAMFLMGFESGYYMVRNVMLERAVDLTVRDVRLGNGNVPSFATLKQRICDAAVILPDCVNQLQVEMRPVAIAPGAIDVMNTSARCIDLNSSDDPLTDTTFDVGAVNNLMVIRVCSLADPLFPTTGIGAGLISDGFGNYKLVATAAFVNEPGTRDAATVAAAPSSGPSVLASFDAGRGNGDDGFDPGNSEPVNKGGDI